MRIFLTGGSGYLGTAIADAFALDQRFTPARATRDLGWAPAHGDPLDELSRPL